MRMNNKTGYPNKTFSETDFKITILKCKRTNYATLDVRKKGR